MHYELSASDLKASHSRQQSAPAASPPPPNARPVFTSALPQNSLERDAIIYSARRVLSELAVPRVLLKLRNTDKVFNGVENEAVAVESRRGKMRREKRSRKWCKKFKQLSCYVRIVVIWLLFIQGVVK